MLLTFTKYHQMRRKGTDPPISPFKTTTKDTRLAIPALKELEELIDQAKNKGCNLILK